MPFNSFSVCSKPKGSKIWGNTGVLNRLSKNIVCTGQFNFSF